MLSKFIEKWATPTGFVIVIGFIIWLVQVNQWTLEHARRIGETDVELRKLSEITNKMAQNQSRIIALQESDRDQLERINDNLEKLESRLYIKK